MAIDYNSGISSLDSGALDIKYTGDEGPKSPKQIAGGEYNRVLELLEKIRESGPLSEEEKIELQQLIRTLTAKGINVEQLMGESGDMRMASADPTLQDEYDKYVFELQEIHPEAVPMSIEEFRQQAVSGMAEGGIARLGYANGQLVQPGPGRPGYGGPHETYGGGIEAGRDRGDRPSRGPRDDTDRFGYTQQPPKPIHHPGLDKTVVPTPVKIGHDPVTIPKDKTTIEKTRDTFLGVVPWALRQVSKKTTPYYIQHSINKHRKKMGYGERPDWITGEEEKDEWLQQALKDVELAKEGNL